MANGSTRYIIKYVGDITDVLAKIRAIRRATNTLGRSGARNIAPLTQSIERTVKPLKGMERASRGAAGGMKGLFLRAIKTIPIWLALRAVVTGFTTVIRSSIGFLVKWESQLAQVRVVGEASAGTMKVLSQGLLNLQKTLGVSNADLGEGAKLFRQQGRAMEEIIPLLDATARLSLVTGRNITQSVEDLTAILKAFNIEASDSITIVDKLTAVTLQNAITGGDLASGLKQSASTAATFGIELADLIGLITAIQTQTRDSGNTVGRALRTIFVRLGTVAIDTAQQVGKIPFFLDELGRVTTSRTPKLRNLTSVITELAARFKDLESAERAQLAAAVAGVRRSNQITALFQNFDQFIRAQTQAQFGLGEADRAIGILTATTASKIEQVKGAWNSFLDIVADTSAFRGALDSIKSSLEGISFIINPTGTFKTSLIAQLGKDAENFTRQAGGIEQIFKVIEDLRRTNESLNRDPGNKTLIDFSIVKVEALKTAIRRFEGENDINLGIEGLDDVRNTFELLNLLEGSADRLRDTFVEVTVKSDITRTQAELEATVEQVRLDLDRIIGDAFSASAVQFRISQGIESEELEIIGKLLKDLEDPKKTQGIIDNFENIRQSIEAIQSEDGDTSVIISGLEKVIRTKERINKLVQNGINNEKEALKIQEIATSNSIVEGAVKDKLIAIDLESVRTGASALAIIESKLLLLNDVNAQLNKEQEATKSNLEKEKARLFFAKELAETMADENAVLSQLKANGASVLAIEQQRLKFVQDRSGVDSIEAVKQESKIKQEAIKLEAKIQKDLLSITDTLIGLETQRKSQIIQTRIELEKNLGVELKGVAGLKQQVDLLKALKAEQKSVNREAQLSNLQKAIAGARRDQSPARLQRSAFEESRLRSQAQAVGIDPDEFLFDNTELINETQKNIDSLLQNVNSTDNLSVAIQDLTNVISRQESRLSPEQVARATREAGTAGPSGLRGLQRGNVLPQAPIGTLPAITNIAPSLTGAGTPTIVLNVGVTRIEINRDASDQQIQSVVEKELDIDNSRRKVAISNAIADAIRTEGTEVARAVDDRIIKK